ncbi:MAG TPA: protease inhibitor I42 family protein [Anaerolineales bacterium]|nr:protease inhibitor I42 family protein [Anaerolineales bacterium]
MTSEMIDVKVDQEFRIPLQSIATAGYLWKVESLPEAIQLLGSENEKPASDTKPGDSTTQIFRFRTLKPGEHTITFLLSRPWENKAIQTRTVKVKVS